MSSVTASLSAYCSLVYSPCMSDERDLVAIAQPSSRTHLFQLVHQLDCVRHDIIILGMQLLPENLVHDPVVACRAQIIVSACLGDRKARAITYTNMPPPA